MTGQQGRGVQGIGAVAGGGARLGRPIRRGRAHGPLAGVVTGPQLGRVGVGLPLAAGVVGGHGRVEGGARLLQLGVELAQLTGGALGPLLVGAGRLPGGAELADHVLLLVGRDLEIHGRAVHGCGGNHPAPDVCAHGPVPPSNVTRSTNADFVIGCSA